MDSSGLLVQLLPVPGPVQGYADVGLVARGAGADVEQASVPGLVRFSGGGEVLSQVQRLLTDRPDVVYAEAERALSIDVTPDDPRLLDGTQWDLNGSFGINAPLAWDLTTGSTSVTVGVIDTGIDYKHPDLYLNVWLNQSEIPASVRPNLLDVDADGLITFYDLNDSRNQGAGKITDLDGDGRITGGDVLKTTADGGWSDGADGGGNGYRDDLIGWNFINNTNDPMDDNSHGTHCAGTIGAIGNNGVGMTGVNWRVQLAALRFIDASGIGNDFDAATAIRYCADNGIPISSNSWSGGSSTTLNNAINYAEARSHLFVAAAGNSSANADQFPAYPAAYGNGNVISVASTTSGGGLSSFSNYGSVSVDLGAPGSGIYSTVPGGYGLKSGTSMATPHVAGVAALVKARYPSLTAAGVKARILDGVTPLTSLAGKTVTGGLLNANGAVADGPEVTVLDGAALLTDGASTVSWTTTVGAAATKTITVRNSGTQALTLGAVSVTGAGFSLATGPGSGSLAPGASTTFSVRLSSSTEGSFSGNVSFTNNDADESPFDFGLSGTATYGVADGGFEAPSVGSGSSAYRYNPAGSAWAFSGESGLSGNGSAFTSGNPPAPEGAQVAFLQRLGSFSQPLTLGTGSYTVSFRAAQRGNLASNQTFRVLVDGTTVGTFTPSGTSYAAFTTSVFNVSAGAHTLSFVGLNPAGGDNTVFLDAVILNSATPAPPAPGLSVSDSGTAVAKGGTVGFGPTVPGVAVSKTFAVSNTGSASLTLGSVVLAGSGYTLVSDLASNSLAPGQSTTFVVRLDAQAVGAYSGSVSFTTNDLANNPFSFDLSGTVSAAGVSQGGFEAPAVGSGSSSYRYNPAGSAWAFSGESGLSGNGSGFTSGNPAAPEGAQVAFLQRLGSFSQSLAFAAGSYTVTFRAAQRANLASNQTFRVLIDGVAVGTFTPSGTSYATYTTGVFNVSAGAHTLSFVGLNPAGGDNTAFIDAVAVNSATPAPAVSVSDGAAAVAGGSTVNFGPTVPGAPVSKTFSVSNTGSANLTLGTATLSGAGFTLTSDLASNSLAPGQSTTFTVRLDAQAVGAYTGSVSFTTNDPANNPFSFDLSGAVNAASVSEGGFEAPSVGSGSSAYRYNPAGSAWAFSGESGLSGNGSAFTSGNPPAPEGAQVAFLQRLGSFSQSLAFAAGSYTVTFRAAQRGNQFSIQTFRVLIDGSAVGTFTPSGTSYAAFTTSAFNVSAGAHTLSFVGLNPAGGDNTVFLDAVAVNSATPAPAASVSDGAAAVAKGGTVGFGTTAPGVAVSKTFTVSNTGTANLTLGSVTLSGAGFTLVSDVASGSLAPGQSTTFAVRLDAQAGGTYSGGVSFATNDPANNPFSFDLSGVVSNALIIDGGFEAPSVGSGSSAYRYNPAGSAWAFSGESGLSGNGSAFTSGNPPAPEGAQVAFLQRLGSFSQSLAFAAGSYTVTFRAAQRGNQFSIQTFRVLIDGSAVGTFTPSGTSYSSLVTGVFNVSAGAHTIAFVGLNPAGGDNTAFLDAVTINSAAP